MSEAARTQGESSRPLPCSGLASRSQRLFVVLLVSVRDGLERLERGRPESDEYRRRLLAREEERERAADGGERQYVEEADAGRFLGRLVDGAERRFDNVCVAARRRHALIAC